MWRRDGDGDKDLEANGVTSNVKEKRQGEEMIFENVNGAPNLGVNSLKSDEIQIMLKRVCAGQVGECSAETLAKIAEEEYEMDSEVSRRMLIMQKKYISYETLKRDTVPCTIPGASYYNCGTAEVNHYSRGCDAITRCARNIKD
ncbi:hypothetical protein Nepgr_030124 [Nepenthes gracilis]|uniref:Uncharacterized protein n=1 Tax=Nepenthes gracilis TaxID=150966 RepID=A0AAD3TG64_NEPGR|nr:hypothetical protein Nepgr_030124 [Nepenthes gracilis]